MHGLSRAVGASDEELIIEPTFRPHFTVPGSGPAFDAALLEAPELLVAAVRQLIPLVHEMAQAISHETTRQVSERLYDEHTHTHTYIPTDAYASLQV